MIWQFCIFMETIISPKTNVQPIHSNESIICRNDELSWTMSQLSWQFTNRLSATRYLKVKRMGITEILKRIWLFSANKIKSSESFSKQPTQLIIAVHDCHISSLILAYFFSVDEVAAEHIVANSIDFRFRPCKCFIFKTY